MTPFIVANFQLYHLLASISNSINNFFGADNYIFIEFYVVYLFKRHKKHGEGIRDINNPLQEGQRFPMAENGLLI